MKDNITPALMAVQMMFAFMPETLILYSCWFVRSEAK